MHGIYSRQQYTYFFFCNSFPSLTLTFPSFFSNASRFMILLLLLFNRSIHRTRRNGNGNGHRLVFWALHIIYLGGATLQNNYTFNVPTQGG